MIYKNIKIELDDCAKKIINTLNEAGFEAFAVGGCVRDFLLKEHPTDYDITTNAKPSDIKSLFKKTIDTGIEHGTVSVIINNINEPKIFEVTTYRIDGEYFDNRHPDNVIYVDNLIEDLKRRDFTINAFAYNDNVGLVDEFEGIKDLKNKIIKTVGDASIRYKEDALRMLRAIRFSSQLDFEIDENSYNTIKLLSHLLNNVSKERIAVELTKILIGKKPDNIKYLFETGLDKYITNDFNKIILTPSHITNNKIIAYSSLLYEISSDSIEFNDIETKSKILRELKLDNYTISNAKKVLSYKNIINNINDIELKKMINSLGFELAIESLCMYSTKDGKDYSYYIVKIKDFYLNKECIFLNDLKINGNDLIKLGYKGKDIGVILNKLLEFVYENTANNEYDILIKEIKKWRTMK